MHTLHIYVGPTVHTFCFFSYEKISRYLLPAREHSARESAHRREGLASKTGKELEGPRNMPFSPYSMQHKEHYTQERKASRSRENCFGGIHCTLQAKDVPVFNPHASKVLDVKRGCADTVIVWSLAKNALHLPIYVTSIRRSLLHAFGLCPFFRNDFYTLSMYIPDRRFRKRENPLPSGNIRCALWCLTEAIPPSNHQKQITFMFRGKYQLYLKGGTVFSVKTVA